MNPILIPRKESNIFTYIMEYIRYGDDLTVFRFFTGLLKQPLTGFHGELLIVKGKTLKEIGYRTPGMVEDFRFALEIVKKEYKTWQTSTKVSIRPPNSLFDIFNQRSRWYKGIIMEFRHCPFLMKIIIGLRLIIWTFGIFGSWLLVPLWLYWEPFYFAIPGGIYYWVIYIYGVWKSKKPYYFFLIPFFGICEAISIVFTFKQKRNEFVVIDKN